MVRTYIIFRCVSVHRVAMKRQSSSQGRALRTSAMTRAAVGFRAHSGWAALVAVAGPLCSPIVIDRRRIELVEPGIPKQPYHAAEKLGLKEAEKLVRRCTDTARILARQALRAVVDEMREKCRHDVVACGLLLGSGRPLTTLAATLASHALIHTAEGELFRDALRDASQHCGLPVTGVKERDLFTCAAAKLRVPAHELLRRVTEMGRTIGPPWAEDQKHAALVGWLALVS